MKRKNIEKIEEINEKVTKLKDTIKIEIKKNNKREIENSEDSENETEIKNVEKDKKKMTEKIEKHNKELGIHGIKETFHKPINTSETKFHKGSLRSGQKLEFEGSLVIIGDVNSGAEIIAEENIVVLGTLRGLAHSGAKGNKDAIIAAEKILSPQIRIADKIAEFESKSISEKEVKTFAFLNEKEEIVVL